MGRNFWFVLTEKGMDKVGAFFRETGETEWNFDPSVTHYTKLDIKGLIQKGYDQCKILTPLLPVSVAKN